MENKTLTITTPEGDYKSDVTIFDLGDKKEFSDLYKLWRDLNDYITDLSFGGSVRTVNLPEILSEGAFCLFTDSYRVNEVYGTSSSYDCYNPKNQKRIQVKATSVSEDLTSFGPRSVWDELYFMDFYRKGDWDGTFDIYFIENELVYNQYVNKNETFKDQQMRGVRPRFSIVKKIIRPNNLKPLITGSFT